MAHENVPHSPRIESLTRLAAVGAGVIVLGLLVAGQAWTGVIGQIMLAAGVAGLVGAIGALTLPWLMIPAAVAAGLIAAMSLGQAVQVFPALGGAGTLTLSILTLLAAGGWTTLAAGSVVAGQDSDRRSAIMTIGLGMILIAIITPTSQFLTAMVVSADLEVATPVGWAVGILFALVLALGAVRLVARRTRLSRPNLVILYTMLTIAVPVMNLGLVRQSYLSMFGVVYEYLYWGSSTYRTAIDARNDAWFPYVPHIEGMAWSKSDRLIGQLDNTGKANARIKAQKTIEELVRTKTLEMEPVPGSPDTLPASPQAQATVAEMPPAVAKPFAALGPAELLSIHEMAFGPSGSPALRQAMHALGMTSELLQSRARELTQQSDAARLRLMTVLPTLGEFEVSIAPDFFNAEKIDLSNRGRMTTQLEDLPEARQAELKTRAAMLGRTVTSLLAPENQVSLPATQPSPEAQAAAQNAATQVRQAVQMAYAPLVETVGPLKLHQALSADLGQLTEADRNRVREELTQLYTQRFRAMSHPQVHQLAAGYRYRLTRDERRKIYGIDGAQGTPNENMNAFIQSLWDDQQSQNAKNQLTLQQNVEDVYQRLPWNIWLTPVLMWCLMFLVIFLFLMCLTEWLRRKWIEKENLAFPLVDVADYLMRPAAELETAEDLRNPTRRSFPINPLLLVGAALGAFLISLEAVNHYNLIHFATPRLEYNISGLLANTGMRQLTGVFLVVSPIVVGLAFLVSLEVSFSVWATFLIYALVVFFGRGTELTNLKDTFRNGFGGGALYPYPLEQMLGAMLCYAGILLGKAWLSGRAESRLPAGPGYVPRKLNVVGLVLLPACIWALLWWVGVRDVLLLSIFSLFVLAQTVAEARVRAETGLYTHHVSYDFSTMPMLTGITGWTGTQTLTNYVSVTFLPISLLFRTVPQQLENIELARRHKVGYGTIAIASLAAFVTAISVGMFSFLMFIYYLGQAMVGEGKIAHGQGPGGYSIARTPSYVIHFQGEQGLENFTIFQWHRFWFFVVGFAVVAVLFTLRRFFLKFPLHPVGYLLMLFSIYYNSISPYFKGPENDGPKDMSWLWGSFLVAWFIKWMVIKYGGMNTYKRAKPLFVGLVIGAVVALFAWNMTDLVCSILGEQYELGGETIRAFMERPLFTPRLY